MTRYFVILGGMGTLASENFTQVMNQRLHVSSDQDYLDYILVNHASIPDRTAYILDNSLQNPTDGLIDDIHKMNKLDPLFYVLTCNTAHFFYDLLQKETERPILHMPMIAAKKAATMKHSNDSRIGILATTGTLNAKTYDSALKQQGFSNIIKPSGSLQEKIMSLIYDDIKQQKMMNHQKFQEILNEAFDVLECDIVILGCTELSLIYDTISNKDERIVDAQSEVIDHTIELALTYKRSVFNQEENTDDK